MWRIISFGILLVSLCSAVPTPRIVNGTAAENGEFPFMASLRALFTSHSCGCTILNNRWLLTAAHCVVNFPALTMTVQYGTNRISALGPHIRFIEKTIVHEGYDPNNYYIHDIALVKLLNEITFSATVQPVQLPPQDLEVPGGTGVTLIGWGLDETGGTIQNDLQKVDLITYSDEECSILQEGRTHPTNICAGVPGGGQGQCNGDSGGPLIGDAGQLGIVSWSIKPCTIAPYPGVLTKVSHYINWIQEKVSTN